MTKIRKQANRREFLKQGITGLMGVAVLPAIKYSGDDSRSESNQKKHTIKHRVLGNTGIKMPVISLGSSYNPSLVKNALEAGMNHIFTSEVYGKGQHEKLIGEILKGRPRNKYLISTSIYMPYLTDVRTKLFRKGITAQTLIDMFEGSLKRLGLDYVDFYYIGGVANKASVQFEPFLSTLQKFKKDGKIRFCGVTTHMNEPEVLRAAAVTTVYDIVMTAYNFLQPHGTEVKKAIAVAAKAGLGVVAFKTQAGGFLDKERLKPINHTAAVKWVLKDKNVHSVILGVANFDQLNQGLKIMENLSLNAAEKTDLQMAVSANIAGLYCSQCDLCRLQCKSPTFDIPTYMRSYMYAYGYRSPAKARTTLLALGDDMIPCGSCESCRVRCPQGICVKERIKDIARLKMVPGEFLA